MLSGISVKDLEGETNGMYAVKAGEKKSEIGRTVGERGMGCEGRSREGEETSKRLQYVFMVQ